MDRCHENEGRLLDFLYGLLEPAEVAKLEEHLLQCAGCRDAFAGAQGQRRLMARAAQVFEQVPEFKVPAGDGQTHKAAILETASATLSFPTRRARPWVVWTSFAAAAAIMLAVYGVYEAYQGGLAARQNDVRLAHKKVEDNAARANDLRANLETKQKELVGRLAAQSLHLVALGPTVLEADGSGPIRIFAEDLEGKPLNAKVHIRLIDEKTQKAIFEKVEVASAGMAAFQLPPLPAGIAGMARLSISAAGSDAIEEKIHLAGSSLVTHLATNKAAYAPGELLFFRTVTLERFSLKPTTEKLRLKFSLLDVTGRTIKQFFGTVLTGGIAGGEIALADSMPGGEYVLEIREAVDTGRMSPVRRRLQVRGKPEAERKTPPVDTSVFVDFFPEGGELIAGIESRVYYRVRNSQGAPVDFDGRLFIGDTQVSLFSAGAMGSLGVFPFTPKKGETYEAKVVRQSETIKVACRLNELVRERGVALSVPAGGGEGDPLRLEIHNVDSPRTLLAVATCRGRIVDQSLFTAQPGKTEISLTPIAGAHGVLRVTLYEGERPVAERLVYRPTSRRLQLSATRNLVKSGFGQRTELQIFAKNEKNEPAHAWLLAHVADAKVARKPGSDLAAHFYLSDELDSPEALEQADILAENNPQSLAAIDLFLGTHGWRRFVRAEKPAPALAQAPAGDKTPLLGLFCRENQSHSKLRQRFEQALAQATVALRQEGQQEKTRLQEQREQAEAELLVAQSALTEYRNRPQAWLRMAVAGVVVVLLVVGAGCLAWGFVQVARRRLATPSFAVAAAGLGVCLFLFAIAGHLPGPQDGPAAGARRGMPDFEPAAFALAKADARTLPFGYLQGLLPSAASTARAARTPAIVDLPQVASADLKIRYDMALKNEAGARSMAFVPSGKPPQALKAADANAKNLEKVPPKVDPPKDVQPQAAPQMPGDLYARQYAFREVKKETGYQDLILWSPVLILPKGSASVAFDLPADVSSFRMFLYGHSPDGRFGFHEQQWDK